MSLKKKVLTRRLWVWIDYYLKVMITILSFIFLWHIIPFVVITFCVWLLGHSLNMIAILSNDYQMPVYINCIKNIDDRNEFMAVTQKSPSHCLATPNTKYRLLCDFIPFVNPHKKLIMSIGDIVMHIGYIIWFGGAILWIYMYGF